MTLKKGVCSNLSRFLGFHSAQDRVLEDSQWRAACSRHAMAPSTLPASWFIRALVPPISSRSPSSQLSNHNRVFTLLSCWEKTGVHPAEWPRAGGRRQGAALRRAAGVSSWPARQAQRFSLRKLQTKKCMDPKPHSAISTDSTDWVAGVGRSCWCLGHRGAQGPPSSNLKSGEDTEGLKGLAWREVT